MTGPASWQYLQFGVLVTGKGEEDCIDRLFRSLMETGRCHFKVLRPVGQRKPVGDRKQRAYIGRGQVISNRDAEIGAQIRTWLRQSEAHRLVWIDDLESEQRPMAAEKYQRLRSAIDTMLANEVALKSNASVHFLVNMLEAYYFAHSDTVNEVLATNLADHAGDCENIVHPKNELKRLAKQAGVAFDERSNGAEIVPKLNLDHILSNPQTCRALRTLVAWCWEAIGEPRSEKFRLTDGVYWDITAAQLSDLPPAEQRGPLAAEESYQPLQN